MCGIAGVYRTLEGKADLEIARKMGAIMTHRGPDNFGFEARRSVAVAHNRLSLLDLSAAANQPFSNDRFLLVYNGEIYNFREIRARLEKQYGISFRTTSDTEVLFESLIHEGVEATLQSIRGMFAFAFYDQESDEIVLARDRMGIKPLHYYHDSGSLYFASEIKAIAKVLDLKPDPIRTLFSANNQGEKSNEFTLFTGLKSLHPGCYLSINSGNRVRITTYYDVVDDFDPEYYSELEKSPADIVLRKFDELFNESVSKMLVSDVPVGVFVSGGVDSSLISAVASKLKPDIHLFTANVVGQYSEASDVQLLSKYIDKTVNEYQFEPQMMLRDWADVTYHNDCPIVIHVNSIPFSNVARLARDSGIKPILSGEGADELFLGYPQLLARRFDSVAAFPVNLVKSVYKVLPALHNHLFPSLRSSPLSLLNALVQGFEIEQLRDRAAEKLNTLSGRAFREQYLTINLIKEHLVTLLHRNDRIGMMGSIEARIPFLDEDIVKFAVNLPSKFKIGRSFRLHNFKHPFLIDKWIVRKTAEKYLPIEIARKKKNGFPMYGHKFVRVKNGFFANGWITESLGLSRSSSDFLIEQNPYLIAKLASVEIFGRIFGLNQSLDSVKEHIETHSEVLVENGLQSPSFTKSASPFYQRTR